MASNSLRKMSLIVAMDLENGIGKNGAIPWYLKKDFAFFVDQTTKVENPEKMNVVIMGRKCWESIPVKFRPLKKRFNVVVSRTLPEERNENLVITSDLNKILQEISFGPDAHKYETIWNIGGREIYNMALQENLAERLVVTKIQSKFDADVKMPDIDWNLFEEDRSLTSEEFKENDLTFSFHFYNRKQ